ncbi:MAG: hypothetical protein ACLTTQ_04355 [Christensenellales bacterium]
MDKVSRWVCMLALVVGLAWIVLAVYLIFCRRVVRAAWLEAVLYLSETALGLRYLINLAVSGQLLYPIPLIIISACMTAYCVAAAVHDRRAKNGGVKECVGADGMADETDVSAASAAHSTESKHDVPTEVDAGALHRVNDAPLGRRRLRKVLISLADGLLNAAAAFLIVFLFSGRYFSASEFGISNAVAHTPWRRFLAVGFYNSETFGRHRPAVCVCQLRRGACTVSALRQILPADFGDSVVVSHAFVLFYRVRL